jgi:RHS repeat-associated protein
MDGLIVDFHVNYDYYPNGKLKTVTDSGGSVTEYFWREDGQLDYIQRDNGTKRKMKYDAYARTIGIEEWDAAGKPIYVYRAGYNLNNWKNWSVDFPKIDASAMNSLATAQYNADNELATINGESVVHDDNGNMTYGPLLSANQMVTYGYDERDRLNSLQGVAYRYDDQNLRIEVTTEDDETTRYAYDPNTSLSRLMVKIDPDGTNHIYVYGIGLLHEYVRTTDSLPEPIKQIVYHYDNLGSTIALSDYDGSVTDHFRYSAYGQLISRKGNTQTPFQYMGIMGVQTDPNGLLYMRARYYNPFLGRFINADPSQFAGGMNWYAYAGGSPLSMVDPSGLAPGFGVLDGVQHVLSVAGAVSGPVAPFFDIANGFLSLARGNVTDAATNFVCAIPGFGDAIGAGKVMTAGASVGMVVTRTSVRYADEAVDMGRAAANKTAYRAIKPEFTQSTLENGFYRSGVAGRLGNDGIYANSSVRGAVKEFQYHNPGVTPTVFEVNYPAGSSLNVCPPTGNFYIESPLPFTQGANVLTAPSLRQPGTTNYLIRSGATPGRIVQ